MSLYHIMKGQTMLNKVQEVAEEWARIHARQQEMEVRKRELSAILQDYMKTQSILAVPVSFGTVELVRSVQKRAGKKDIETFFGPGPTEQFWDALAPKVSEYLSLVKASL